MYKNLLLINSSGTPTFEIHRSVGGICRKDENHFVATRGMLAMFCIKPIKSLLSLHNSRYGLLALNKKSAMSGSVQVEKPLEHAIKEKLSTNFSPVHLNIINESYMHNVPKGSETHFKVVIVSDKFENVSLLQRHRMVNETLEYEFKNGIHALSIVAKTPAQWAESNDVPASPKCLGGSKSQK